MMYKTISLGKCTIEHVSVLEYEKMVKLADELVEMAKKQGLID